ncbi:hypothetical protein GALMADRAFT_459998 [Galerina marginata CBS 339.88]|uniref:Uncharacterized protein n=1 Tax=Galerina marginata (strain CBS 339.88) TaxID=685588 RepID=A0A067T855_GALM3|nr:hypothetical protein GALMADRAFT_459998 [Galerina marginata CBS 339.88]
MERKFFMSWQTPFSLLFHSVSSFFELEAGNHLGPSSIWNCRLPLRRCWSHCDLDVDSLFPMSCLSSCYLGVVAGQLLVCQAYHSQPCSFSPFRYPSTTTFQC